METLKEYMKKQSKGVVLLIVGVLILIRLILNVSAEIPKIEPYVNDFAGLLNFEEELKLNMLADEIEKNTTYEIAIVTVLNTEGQDRLEYANKIGDENGVGKKDMDNGIVVLWSLENEKGGAIATGRGSESIFNDAKVGRIGREAREIYCDKEEYYNCFEFIINELKKEIVSYNSTIINETSSEDNSQSPLFWVLVIIVAGGLFIISILPNSSDSSSHSNSTISFPSSSSSGGFRGGSFGGGSFGGAGGKF